MNRNTPSDLQALACTPREHGCSVDQARLRILRCTAHAMASSPGGLRFVAGTKPWLEGLTGGKPPSKPSATKRRFMKPSA